MSSRDDMVIRPVLKERRASAAVRAREERRMMGTRRGSSLVRRAAALRAARRTILGSRAGRAHRRALTRGRASRGSKFGIGRMAARMGPGGMIAAVLGAAAALGRSVSDRSFESMGQTLSNAVFQDMDDEAHAKMEVRQQFIQDPAIMVSMAQHGSENAQLRSIFTDLVKIRTRELERQSRVAADPFFSVNSVVDNFILRGKELVLEAFFAAGGQAAMDNLKDAFQKVFKTTNSAR